MFIAKSVSGTLIKQCKCVIDKLVTLDSVPPEHVFSHHDFLQISSEDKIIVVFSHPVSVRVH